MNCSILTKSRSYMSYMGHGADGNLGVHDYEYCACKVIEKGGINEKHLKLIENEIIN